MVNSDIYIKMKIVILFKKISEILSDYKRAKKKAIKGYTVCLDLIKKRLYLNY